MGEQDIRLSEYLGDKERFSDIFNGVLFSGEQVIDKHYLEPADSEVRTVNKRGTVKRLRDKAMYYKKICRMLVMVLENQNSIDYGMVIRNMLDESMEYDRQRRMYMKKHKKDRDSHNSDEYVSGMNKGDLLNPVITLVVYHGSKEWDAPKNLYDMLDLGDFTEREKSLLKKYINDYHIYVFDYHDYDNFEIFQTDLKQVFTFLKYAKDKKKLRGIIEENREEWYNIENETCELIAELTNSYKLMEYLQNGKESERGGLDMGNAIDEIYNDGVEWGLDKGRNEGKMITLIMQSRKKQAKGKTAEEAAEALEEDVQVITQLYHLIKKYPDKNEEELYAEYQKNK